MIHNLTQHTLDNEHFFQAKDFQALQSMFLQNVGHELRTPLSIILGYAILLHEETLGGLTPKQQQATTHIIGYIQKLQTLIEQMDVLLAAEMRRGYQEPLLLSDVVHDVLETKKLSIQQAGLTLSLETAEDIPVIFGDEQHLSQAIRCLLDNAIKFTPRNRQIGVQVYEDAGHVCVAVSDMGIGIDADELRRIFTPFYQVDGSSARRYNGLGLGLGIVRAVVDEHDGEIEVDSQIGDGSRFTLKFPVTRPVTQVKELSSADSAAQTTWRVLIVDDEENVVNVLQESLSSLPGCEVFTATHAHQALRILEQTPCDLLVTDYRMPDMDGLALASRVFQLYPETPVIVISAYIDKMLEESNRLSSIQQILNKPVDLIRFRHVVLTVLSGNTMGSEQANGE